MKSEPMQACGPGKWIYAVPFILPALMAATILLQACQSFNADMFLVETVAATTARAAVEGYKDFYAIQTNGAAPEKLAALNHDLSTVYDASRALAATLMTLDGFREAYATNAMTKGQVLAAVNAASLSASNVVWTINFVRAKP